MEQAETYRPEGLSKKNYEIAIEIMFNSESILVGGETIPREIVRKRLENISYEQSSKMFEQSMQHDIEEGFTKSIVDSKDRAKEYRRDASMGIHHGM